jgi:threonylcarbamoyladenosine tRNA methylthiotransferase MtaB
MTGFPGESENEFAESVAFIESLPFTYLHVFTYSERPGTKAMDLPGCVPMEVRRERNRILQQVSERKNFAFRQSQSGQSVRAITLGGNTALSTNYIRVELSQPRAANQLIEITLGKPTARGMAELSLFPVLA